MSENQFTGTATQPQRNRKLCQFNNDQYCMLLSWCRQYHFKDVGLVSFFTYINLDQL